MVVWSLSGEGDVSAGSLADGVGDFIVDLLLVSEEVGPVRPNGGSNVMKAEPSTSPKS